MDFGLRAESQVLAETIRLAPRAGVAWSPSKKLGTVVRTGLGLFYDRVPLNVYAFDHYPNQIITQYDASGQISGGPYFFQNGLGQVIQRAPLVFQEKTAGNFSPRSSTWSVQIEQPVSRFLRLRTGYMQNQSAVL